MDWLGIIFQSEEKNSMVAEALDEYALDSEEVSYEEPREQATIWFMASGVEYHEVINPSLWLDHKHPSFTIPDLS